MSKEIPDEKFEIPDSCSRIKIIIKRIRESLFRAAVLRHSLAFFFDSETSVDIQRLEGKEYDNLYIEIKKNPKIPLTHGEKQFLRKIYGVIGCKISFE